MPQISRFYGIIILMNYKDHLPPHFHAIYNEYEIIVNINNFKWMIQSTDYVAPNQKIGIYIEPDAIHIMKKSEYSNMFGDYSSFSDELERLSDATEEEE